MKLILAGIEHSGTTTLGEAISKWFTDATGAPYGFHDHFKIPHTGHGEFTEDEQQQILDLSPRLKETLQRHQIYYHVQPAFYLDGDISSIGLHIEDAVYGPLYWGYGAKGMPGDSSEVTRDIEDWILEAAPETVLALLTASPEVIAQRMKESPRKNSPLREEDIPKVLGRFQEEFDRSRILHKISLDTSMATVEETLAQFVELVGPYLEEADRLRMEIHSVKPAAESP